MIGVRQFLEAACSKGVANLHNNTFFQRVRAPFALGTSLLSFLVLPVRVKDNHTAEQDNCRESKSDGDSCKVAGYARDSTECALATVFRPQTCCSRLMKNCCIFLDYTPMF